MKRWICGILCLMLLLPLVLPVQARAAGAPSRIIHVVYDDSGSMYGMNGNVVDTWCQAKYAMEVFAAMLGQQDKMSVYYMSDYEYSTAAGPRMTLEGKDGAEANVAKIHNEKTYSMNTPFNSVRKAFWDLESVQADEKWLVILTDGIFQDVAGKQGIDEFLGQKSRDMKILFLGMGDAADGITEKQDQNIFYVSASTNSQILSSITGMCTRIFNSNKLEVNVSSKKFSFDVPMGELIVFAQGANVQINGIRREDGSLIQASKNPVEVKYSQCDATNFNNPPTTDLLGSIATFQDDFQVGSYTVDVTGAETIEIYYKPNVEVAAYLTDKDGNSVSDLSSLAAGEYTITFGFVKAGTTEKVSDSKLLGNVTYSAMVTNNGVTHENPYGNGDKIILQEGTLDIDVTASYLDYNSVSTQLSYSIYQDKGITFTFANDPQYIVDSEGFREVPTIRVEALLDGKPLTAQQWEAMDTPTVALASGLRDFKLDTPTIEKSQEPGVFYITPQLPDGKPSVGTYKDVGYTLTYQQKFGSETWQGSGNGELRIQDARSWWERNWDLFVKLIILLVILVILAGYLPIFKHYLPKTLKKIPYIKCVPGIPGEKRKDRSGQVDKNLLSTIIPYVPQTGTIRYVPKGITGCPALEVRAIKRRRMTITNIQSFAGKTYITFDGESIKKDVKKFETGAGVNIQVKKNNWTYICSPNQTKNN